MNCYQAKAGELAKHWYVIDATDMVVGRLAAQIAPILMGKHRPTYTPHIDTGDYVIVTNVDKVVFTGNKWQQKIVPAVHRPPRRSEGRGGLEAFQRHPDRILQLAIQRMMPKNKIGRHMMAKLKLYAGPQHPHQAQAPIPLEALSGRPTPSGAIYRPEPDAQGAPGARVKKAVEAAEQPQAAAVAQDEPQTPPPPTITDTAMHEPTAPGRRRRPSRRRPPAES